MLWREQKQYNGGVNMKNEAKRNEFSIEQKVILEVFKKRCEQLQKRIDEEKKM